MFEQANFQDEIESANRSSKNSGFCDKWYLYMPLLFLLGGLFGILLWEFQVGTDVSTTKLADPSKINFNSPSSSNNYFEVLDVNEWDKYSTFSHVVKKDPPQTPSLILLGPAHCGTRSFVNTMDLFLDVFNWGPEFHYWSGTNGFKCLPDFDKHDWKMFLENFQINNSLQYIAENVITSHLGNGKKVCQMSYFINRWKHYRLGSYYTDVSNCIKPADYSKTSTKTKTKTKAKSKWSSKFKSKSKEVATNIKTEYKTNKTQNANKNKNINKNKNKNSTNKNENAKQVRITMRNNSHSTRRSGLQLSSNSDSYSNISNINRQNYCWTMEKAPSYSRLPIVAPILAYKFPDIKTIVISRNPITAFWSTLKTTIQEELVYEYTDKKAEMIAKQFIGTKATIAIQEQCIALNNAYHQLDAPPIDYFNKNNSFKNSKYENIRLMRYAKLLPNITNMMREYLFQRFVKNRIERKVRKGSNIWIAMLYPTLIFWISSYDAKYGFSNWNHLRIIQFEYLYSNLNNAMNIIKCWLQTDKQIVDHDNIEKFCKESYENLQTYLDTIDAAHHAHDNDPTFNASADANGGRVHIDIDVYGHKATLYESQNAHAKVKIDARDKILKPYADYFTPCTNSLYWTLQERPELLLGQWIPWQVLDPQETAAAKETYT